MKNSFDLIIFDWDGTLINSIDWIADCLQQAGANAGYPPPDRQAAKDVIGLSIDHAIQVLFPDADADAQTELIRHYSQNYAAKEIGPDDLFDGVGDMLARLKDDGYRLAVATGKTRAGLNKALAGTGTADFFCTTRCADETASKPHPRMLDEIVQHTGIPKQRALMIGDSRHDLQMAQNAAISAVAVTCGAHAETLLQRYQPLLCLKQPTELLAYFQD